jgi:hypothetical protein
MMRKSGYLRSTYLGLCVLAILGCDAPPGFRTVPVSGTITRNGNPLEGAAVSFIPDVGGESATGITDSAGKYQLTTRQKDDGAVPGQYKVTIAKYAGQSTATTAPGEATADYDISNEYPEGYNPDTQDSTPSRNLLPLKYASPGTSGFEANVVEGENTIDFDVKG